MSIFQTKQVTIALILILTLGCGKSEKPLAESSPSVKVETGASQVKVDQEGIQVSAKDVKGETDVTIASDGVKVHAEGGGDVHTDVDVSANGIKVHTDGNHKGAEVSVSAAGISIETDKGQTVNIGENVTVGENVKITSGGVELTGGDVQVEISDSSGSKGKIVITGMSEERKIDGEGKDIVVSGASNDITITGTCSSLVVSGASNDVSLESSQKIVVTGTSNDVTYSSGTPKIVNTGVNNSVEKG